jgi:hypothetical protein
MGRLMTTIQGDSVCGRTSWAAQSEERLLASPELIDTSHLGDQKRARALARMPPPPKTESLQKEVVNKKATRLLSAPGGGGAPLLRLDRAVPCQIRSVERHWEWEVGGGKSNPGAAAYFKPGPRKHWGSKASGSHSSTQRLIATRCLRWFSTAMASQCLLPTPHHRSAHGTPCQSGQRALKNPQIKGVERDKLARLESRFAHAVEGQQTRRPKKKCHWRCINLRRNFVALWKSSRRFIYPGTYKQDFSEEITALDAQCKLLSRLLFRSALTINKSVFIVSGEKKSLRTLLPFT